MLRKAHDRRCANDLRRGRAVLAPDRPAMLFVLLLASLLLLPQALA